MTTPQEGDKHEDVVPAAGPEVVPPIPDIASTVSNGTFSSRNELSNRLENSDQTNEKIEEVQRAITEAYAELDKPKPNFMNVITSMGVASRNAEFLTPEIKEQVGQLKIAVREKKFRDVETNEKMRGISEAMMEAIPHLDPTFMNGVRIRSTSQIATAVWEGVGVYIPRAGEQAAKFLLDAGRNEESKKQLILINDRVQALVQELGPKS